jgi:hypothetical protein
MNDCDRRCFIQLIAMVRKSEETCDALAATLKRSRVFSDAKFDKASIGAKIE